MNGQFSRVTGSRRRLADALVRLVAERSLPQVTSLVAGRTDGMSLSETRGYIRARAGREVRRQTRWVLERDATADPAWEGAVVVRATERVVALLVRQGAAEYMRRAA
jgi:hypothetical protein